MGSKKEETKKNQHKKQKKAIFKVIFLSGNGVQNGTGFRRHSGIRMKTEPPVPQAEKLKMAAVRVHIGEKLGKYASKKLQCNRWWKHLNGLLRILLASFCL